MRAKGDALCMTLGLGMGKVAERAEGTEVACLHVTEWSVQMNSTGW